MKFLQVTSNGTENCRLESFSCAVIYVEGSEGGASFSVSCHGTILGTVSVAEPLLITFGKGAPLKLVTSGGTSINAAFYAYPA